MRNYPKLTAVAAVAVLFGLLAGATPTTTPTVHQAVLPLPRPARVCCHATNRKHRCS